MKFSHFAGVALMPLLARLLLCAAFLPQGYRKVFTETTFEGDAARALSELGVGTPVDGADDMVLSVTLGVVLAAYQQTPTGNLRPRPQEEQPSNAAPAAAEQEQEQGEEQAAGDENEPPTEQAAASEPGGWDGRPVRARTLHSITALLDTKGWPRDWQPQAMGWCAGLTELLGGGLLLIGLFSRIWGLGLAITMGFAFHLTSWPALVDPNVFALADDISLYQRVYLQLALGILALGVCLTGPGPLSVDRLFFGRRSTYEAPEV